VLVGVVSLSKDNFLHASQLWHTEGRESEPPYFGGLQSELPYEPSTLNLKTRVRRFGRLRSQCFMRSESERDHPGESGMTRVRS